ncbi:MAG: hypothetical protein IPJ65_09090 [Archangiaceae bacterium]|nr:hypothetical protein [Archangiaceae bacterium]
MSKGRYEVVGRLPPGQGGKTSLAVMGGSGAFRRIAVLRPVGDAALLSVANVHPQLPAPLGIEEVAGEQCAAYDFFPGANLEEICGVYQAQGQLPPLGLVLRIVVDAARVINVAHEHQDPLGGHGAFVHGGIADSSLLLGFDGEVRVLDFGLRKLTRFSAPEAVAGGPFTSRCDVFSLAAAVHASLTGFERNYAATLAKAPSAQTFPPPSSVHPDASAELDSLLMRALMPDPARRLASAAELADDLERIAGENMPQPQACASRLKQLFEERLDGFRNMVPRLSSDSGAASGPRPKASRPGAEPPPAPRRSGPRSIPKGTQPEANPVGRRPTPPEVLAFGDPELDDLADESTIVVDSNPALLDLARPTGEQKRVAKGGPDARGAERPSGKSPKKPAAPLTDVPWDEGVGAQTDPDRAAQQTSGAEMANSIDVVPIEDVPTGLSRRAMELQQQSASGGSTEAEKAAARGQELVQTGDVEPDDADDLRDQPTVVRVSGTHQKLIPPSAEDVAAAFGDPGASDEAGTAILPGSAPPAGPQPGGPPVLYPQGSAELKEPDTGVLEHNKKKAAPETSTVDGDAAKKKRSKGPRLVIAVLLLGIASGLGYLKLKKPALFDAKVQEGKARVLALLEKYKLKKATPAPEGTDDPAVAVDDDGGTALAAPGDAADGGSARALPVLEDDYDGGEEEEDDDGGVFAGDAGRHPDGGVIHKVKRKKKRGSKQWWQTK